MEQTPLLTADAESLRPVVLEVFGTTDPSCESRRTYETFDPSPKVAWMGETMAKKVLAMTKVSSDIWSFYYLTNTEASKSQMEAFFVLRREKLWRSFSLHTHRPSARVERVFSHRANLSDSVSNGTGPTDPAIDQDSWWLVSHSVAQIEFWVI